jgi:hypothetical protein
VGGRRAPSPAGRAPSGEDPTHSPKRLQLLRPRYSLKQYHSGKLTEKVKLLSDSEIAAGRATHSWPPGYRGQFRAPPIGVPMEACSVNMFHDDDMHPTIMCSRESVAVYGPIQHGEGRAGRAGFREAGRFVRGRPLRRRSGSRWRPAAVAHSAGMARTVRNNSASEKARGLVHFDPTRERQWGRAGFLKASHIMAPMVASDSGTFRADGMLTTTMHPRKPAAVYSPIRHGEGSGTSGFLLAVACVADHDPDGSKPQRHFPWRWHVRNNYALKKARSSVRLDPTARWQCDRLAAASCSSTRAARDCQSFNLRAWHVRNVFLFKEVHDGGNLQWHLPGRWPVRDGFDYSNIRGNARRHGRPMSERVRAFGWVGIDRIDRCWFSHAAPC